MCVFFNRLFSLHEKWWSTSKWSPISQPDGFPPYNWYHVHIHQAQNEIVLLFLLHTVYHIISVFDTEVWVSVNAAHYNMNTAHHVTHKHLPHLHEVYCGWLGALLHAELQVMCATGREHQTQHRFATLMSQCQTNLMWILLLQFMFTQHLVSFRNTSTSARAWLNAHEWNRYRLCTLFWTTHTCTHTHICDEIF